jgi:modulator of FtsH protease HflC
MNKNPISVIIGVVLLAVFFVLLFVFQVRQSEVAIVTTFSKPSGEPVGPGAHFRLPWPIQKVIKFDQRIQSYEGKLTESQTADNNNLLTQIYVGWRISDPKLFFLQSPDGSTANVERRLDEMLLSAKTAIVGKHPLSDFVSPDGSSKFNVIEDEILKAVQTQLKTKNFGVEVPFVGLKKIGLPESVTQLVFERMKSERDVLSRRFESEGQAEADKIKAKANSEAAKTLAAAESEATRIRAQGQKAAAEVYPTFEQNPELANFLLQLDALESSLKERSTLVFDANTPPFNLLRGGATTNLLKK